jgi:hypothetical protein
MPTGMVRDAGYASASTVEEGGQATLALILNQSTTGMYYSGTRPAKAHPDAYDSAVRARLREATDLALSLHSG